MEHAGKRTREMALRSESMSVRFDTVIMESVRCNVFVLWRLWYANSKSGTMGSPHLLLRWGFCVFNYGQRWR